MKKGFTLSELLLAIAVIGIILVLAVPRVMQNVDQKTKITGLQSVYNVLNNAISTLMADERAKDMSRTSLCVDDGESLKDAAESFVEKYLNIKKDCNADASICFASAYKNLNGDEVASPEYDDSYCVQISTGASICVCPTANKTDPVRVWIDTNGTERPNVVGRDYFLFYIYEDGLVSDGISLSGNNPNVDPWYGTASFTDYDCMNSINGGGCLYKIINADWAMDYE